MVVNSRCLRLRYFLSNKYFIISLPLRHSFVCVKLRIRQTKVWSLCPNNPSNTSRHNRVLLNNLLIIIQVLSNPDISAWYLEAFGLDHLWVRFFLVSTIKFIVWRRKEVFRHFKLVAVLHIAISQVLQVWTADPRRLIYCFGCYCWFILETLIERIGQRSFAVWCMRITLQSRKLTHHLIEVLSLHTSNNIYRLLHLVRRQGTARGRQLRTLSEFHLVINLDCVLWIIVKSVTYFYV